MLDEESGQDDTGTEEFNDDNDGTEMDIYDNLDDM
jgi:hypothetical protein|tara:strand:- start:9309 stop:9413 length:105 start_codon:yes stop_codon:yes gene_type:complete